MAVAAAQSALARFEAESVSAARSLDLQVEGRERDMARLHRESKVDAETGALTQNRLADTIKAQRLAKKRIRDERMHQTRDDVVFYGRFVLILAVAIAILALLFAWLQ